jgi:hypothetical protein
MYAITAQRYRRRRAAKNLRFRERNGRAHDAIVGKNRIEQRTGERFEERV